MVMTRCPAGALSARKTVGASSVYLETTGARVRLAQVNSETETDSNPDGFIVQTKTAVGDWQGVQPITCVWSRDGKHSGAMMLIRSSREDQSFICVDTGSVPGLLRSA